MPFTIEECAEQFGISPRTVRHDIQEINDFLSRHGYKALGIDGTKIINPMSDVELQGAIEKIQGFYCYKLSPEERQLLIQIMLIHGEGYQTYSQIADELMVSRVTIINDLVKVKAWFAYRNLQVESLSNKGIRLCGTEISRRQAIIESVSSVYGSIQEKPVVVEYIEDLAETAFSKDTVEFLRCQIIRQEAIHGHYLTDQSFTILIFYLSYVFFRISQGKVVQSEDGGPGVNRMAAYLLKSMGEYWGMDMPEGEAQFLSLILDSLHYIKKSKRDEKIIMLQIQTSRFIEIISTALKLDLNHDYVFYQDLANHLESIIVQHCHMPSNNEVVR
ncbi:MAG: BglG family transcription antiterminator, partial [Eubacterium aggregans]